MRQFHLAIAIAATIGLSTLTFAQAEERKPDQQNPRAAKFRERLLKEFDADGDGKLNDEEQAKARAAAAKLRGNTDGAGRLNKGELMKRFDKDGDGQLSDAERAALRESIAKRGAAGDGAGPRPGGRGDQIPAEVLKRFDEDGDGKLNEEERQAAMKAREEFMKRSGAAGPGRDFPNREALIKKFDKDGDGKLDENEQASAREAMTRFQKERAAGAAPGAAGQARKPRVDKKELLEKFDADGDGKLNEEERAKAVKEFKNRNKE